MAIDVDAVLASLTLDDKVDLLGGFDAWHTADVSGVGALRCTDGPAGARGTDWDGPPSASFPCGTALGASFDPRLVEEVGAALGREARSKGAQMLLAPTVNLHRTPIGGRNFECISEDPVLTAEIGAAYVRGLQGERVAACIKHFVGNDTEFERMTISSEIDERTLRELYLVPFERSIGEGVRALMTAYNKVNGTYMADHLELTRGVLRDEWGFDGVVVSDWFGLHSTVEGVDAGVDLEMPGPPRQRGELLVDALRDGKVSEARVDESVRRLLALFDWSGVGQVDRTERTDDSPATRRTIRRAAIAGTVLLSNDGVLPLAPTASIALIGPNAADGEVQGGGSARVKAHRPVGPLDGLRSRGVDVDHVRGVSIDKQLPAMEGEFTVELSDPGGAVVRQPAERLAFIWMTAQDGVAVETMTVRVSGTFVPSETGSWSVSLMAVGPAVLRIDGQVIVDLSVPQTGGGFFANGSPEIIGTVELRAGMPCTVEVDNPPEVEPMLRGFTVGARPPTVRDEVIDAAAAAGRADVAVLVVGTNAEWETESADRETMDLPGDQDRLISAVAAANPRTVVVINAGSPVSMPWVDEVAAVLQVWFPGEEFGEALADVLLGVAEPGGRLPVTIPRELADTPAHAHYPGVDGKAVYGEGLLIGHRWYDARGIAPRFAFGHGLGYTTMTIEDPSVSPVSSPDGEGLVVRATVRNTGQRDGSEVVQVYVDGPDGDPDAAPRTLAGFAKVQVPAGGAAAVEILLPAQAFRRWNTARHAWEVPSGARTIRVGRSSADLVPIVGR
jgi:beta-glucosidase